MTDSKPFAIALFYRRYGHRAGGYLARRWRRIRRAIAPTSFAFEFAGAKEAVILGIISLQSGYHAIPEFRDLAVLRNRLELAPDRRKLNVGVGTVRRPYERKPAGREVWQKPGHRRLSLSAGFAVVIGVVMSVPKAGDLGDLGSPLRSIGVLEQVECGVWRDKSTWGTKNRNSQDQNGSEWMYTNPCSKAQNGNPGLCSAEDEALCSMPALDLEKLQRPVCLHR